jgi:hypothetical protein
MGINGKLPRAFQGALPKSGGHKPRTGRRCCGNAGFYSFTRWGHIGEVGSFKHHVDGHRDKSRIGPSQIPIMRLENRVKRALRQVARGTRDAHIESTSASDPALGTPEQPGFAATAIVEASGVVRESKFGFGLPAGR